MAALKREYLGALLSQDPLGNCFPRIGFTMLSHPGTWAVTVMVQVDPDTALAGGRTWHHPRDTGLAGMQIVRVVESQRLPSRFQRKACEAR